METDGPFYLYSFVWSGGADIYEWNGAILQVIMGGGTEFTVQNGRWSHKSITQSSEMLGMRTIHFMS